MTVQVGVRAVIVTITALLVPPIFVSDVAHYWDMARNLGWTSLPYRDFLWEFPPVTVVTLLLVPLSFSTHAVFTFLFVGLMIAVEVLTWRITRGLLQPEARPAASWFWLGVIIPLSSIAYFRLDWPATLFAAIALAGLLGRHTWRTALGVVGGFGVKAWTIVFVGPLIGLKRWKDAAISLALCVAMIVGWHLFSPEGLTAFLEYRQGGGFQIESIPGSVVMLFGAHDAFFEYGALNVSDQGWGWLQTALPALFVVVGGICVVAMWFRRVNLVALVGALVLLLMLTSRLLSPQYLIWMAPFLALLAHSHRRQAITFAVASWLTLVEICFYTAVTEGYWWASILVLARNAALVVLQVDLFRMAFSRQDYDRDLVPVEASFEGQGAQVSAT